MHSAEAVIAVLQLRERGLGPRRIAQETGVAISTVQDWLAGELPSSFIASAAGCSKCRHPEHAFATLPREYVHLLGLYLGDGTLASHPRGVYKLRVFLDKKYPAIIEECAGSMRATMPANRVNKRLTVSNCFEVYSFSRSWPCLFPQHGPGTKHTRRIWLSGWQQQLAERWPEALLRGLIQSDGCRFTNTRGSADTWSAPRYGFKNVSTDITSIFCTACDRLGLRWTGAFPKDESNGVTIYVSRKDDVARMDEFIGPKR